MKVFIFIPWFYPAYKAGGPIQSITNLIVSLEDGYDFYVVTSAYDLNSDTVLKNIIPDDWNLINLPGSKKKVPVWYTQKKNNYITFKHLLKGYSPGIIYLNGIFSYNFFLLPLVIKKILAGVTKVIICPRGMLQDGALSDKRIKKKVYLKTLKGIGLLHKIKWHATNEEEKNDILKYVNTMPDIIVANNIPKSPITPINFINKTINDLRLIYLSLITEKKNLLLLLQTIKQEEHISLDIYGPIKDNLYWMKCEKLIKQMPGKVNYMGDILPYNVQPILAQYHALVLLTKGENFGHALYENLSVGRPIITSKYTPWNNLKDQYAGWNVDIEDTSDCINAFKELNEMSNEQYIKFCEGAYKQACNYYNSMDVNKMYGVLFNE